MTVYITHPSSFARFSIRKPDKIIINKQNTDRYISKSDKYIL